MHVLVYTANREPCDLYHNSHDGWDLYNMRQFNVET
jgi:hypothetical protein